MTGSRERWGVAVDGGLPDRPAVWTFALGITRRVLGLSYGEMLQGGESAARAQLAWLELIPEDAVSAYLDVTVEAEGFGARVITMLGEQLVDDEELPGRRALRPQTGRVTQTEVDGPPGRPVGDNGDVGDVTLAREALEVGTLGRAKGIFG